MKKNNEREQYPIRAFIKRLKRRFQRGFLPYISIGLDADHYHDDLVIAKDDFPLETFAGRPITNFIRRVLHGKHIECHEEYEYRKGIKVYLFRRDASWEERKIKNPNITGKQY